MKQSQFMRTAVIVIALLSTPSACKQRTFSNNKSGGADDPDAPRICPFRLDKKAPYTTEEFKEKLVEAFHTAVKSGSLKEENLRDFLFADEVRATLNGKLEIAIDDCALTRSINESLTKPSYFYWLTGNGRTTEGAWRSTKALCMRKAFTAAVQRGFPVRFFHAARTR